MHYIRLRKRESFSHKTTQALPAMYYSSALRELSHLFPSQPDSVDLDV